MSETVEATGETSAPSFPFVLHEVVRFSDCDPLGHANNASYSTYIEQARRGILGGAFDDCILARVEIDFRSSLEAGEALVVESRCASVGTASFVLEHRIAAEGRLVAEAAATVVSYDYEQARSVPIPKDLAARLQNGRAGSGHEAHDRPSDISV